MTLDEAIKHCKEVAEELRNVDMGELDALYCGDTECIEARKNDCIECADEHKQLANWLKELKQLREQTRWISCGERQPKENGNYLAFYRTSDGTTSLEFMMVDHCNAGGGWLHEENERKAYKKVIAWMPLPTSYRGK